MRFYIRGRLAKNVSVIQSLSPGQFTLYALFTSPFFWILIFIAVAIKFWYYTIPALILIVVIIYFVLKQSKKANKKREEENLLKRDEFRNKLNVGKSELAINSSTVSEISDRITVNSPNFGTDFNGKRKQLKLSFPAAYDFLSFTKSQGNGIWLGTAVNAHLYFNNYYLIYIKLNSNSLIFNPKFNIKIASGTIDRSHLIFPKCFTDLIKSNSGFENGWARGYYNGSYEIFSNAPANFFHELISKILKLK